MLLEPTNVINVLVVMEQLAQLLARLVELFIRIAHSVALRQMEDVHSVTLDTFWLTPLVSQLLQLTVLA